MIQISEVLHQLYCLSLALLAQRIHQLQIEHIKIPKHASPCLLHSHRILKKNIANLIKVGISVDVQIEQER